MNKAESEALSIAQIAKLVGKNPETIRRWIRKGRLKAKINSRREGFVVSQDELTAFMNKKPELPTKLVSVVFCKDCKYADDFHRCSHVNFWNKEDDFCSRGERRENGTVN